MALKLVLVDQDRPASGAGGDLPTLVQAMKAREARRAVVLDELRALELAGRPTDASALREELRGRLEEWNALLDRQTSQARQILKKLLAGPIRFVPETDGRREGWRFRGNGSLVKLLAGSQWASMVASPSGSIPEWTPDVIGDVPAKSGVGRAA